MSSRQDPEYESRITTDREMIRGWAGDHESIPVRYVGTDDESGRLRIIPESERRDEHEELDWEEFFREFEDGDRVVVYHGEYRSPPFEVVERDEAVARSTVESEAVEEALMEGETVTSQVTETTVIERTIIEEATIESEVVDRELLEEEIVDAELLTREAVDCELIDAETSDVGGHLDISRFETGYRGDESFGVEIEVDEGWSVTKEVLERLTIESRVVDTDVTETDTVEADSVEATVDVEGVQRNVLESDLVDSDVATDEIVETRSIESEFGEDDVVETRVLERKTVEEEVSMRRRLTGEIDEGETLESESIRREVIESAIVDREDAEFEMAASGTETEFDEADETEAFVTPSDDDEGKTVVDAEGETIGIVVEVESDTLYVDPHPSLTDRIKALLDWGEMDEDAYPVEADRIARIDDDRIELSVKE